MKTVPYSVRLASEDAEYLASLQISGAHTPSDKLRSIVSAARERDARSSDYSGCIKNLEELSTQSIMQLKEIEKKHSVHSDLLLPAVELARDILALFVAGMNEVSSEKVEKDVIKKTEHEVADKLFYFFEKMALMGIREKSVCYSPDAISSRIDPVKEVFEMMSNKSSKE